MVRRLVYFQGRSLPQIDLSYFDERTVGVIKILVSGINGLETAIEVSGPSDGNYNFSYLSPPNNWVASLVGFDPAGGDANPVVFRGKGQEPLELILPTESGFGLFHAGAYAVRLFSGVGRLYYRDGTDYSVAGVPLEPFSLPLFPGIFGPPNGLRFSPDQTHALRRTAVETIEYQDNTGSVRSLAISGATLPQFALTDFRYTYIPPYLYAIEDVHFFDSAIQTVTVYRNLVDLVANTVRLDGELQAQCRGLALSPDGNDPTPLSAVFYPA